VLMLVFIHCRRRRWTSCFAVQELVLTSSHTRHSLCGQRQT
jgi:hypothetical protein